MDLSPPVKSNAGVIMAGPYRVSCGRPLLVGVLNVTPDSFSDGGRYLNVDAAVAHAQGMVKAGAAILDIGAESSRPGAKPVGEEEELRRLLPVLTRLVPEVGVPISIDTTKASVARRALDAGAAIINDISALRFDPGMAPLIAERKAGVILMHMQGIPQTMQQDPVYQDVVEEVCTFLSERMSYAARQGISLAQMILDPGFGFGKLREHNLALLRDLSALATLGRPIMAGVSRKTFIGQVTGQAAHNRVWGTAAAVALAVEHGASLLRVHDVEAMRDVLAVADAARQLQPGGTPAHRGRHA